MLPDEDPAAFLEMVKKVVNDPAVEVTYGARDVRPGGTSRLNTDAFAAIEANMKKHYDVITLPTMSTGATDMAYLRAKGIQCYGVGPAIDIEDGPKGFGAHSDQERINEVGALPLRPLPLRHRQRPGAREVGRPPVNRRRLLAHGGLALAGLGLGACAPRAAPATAPQPRRAGRWCSCRWCGSATTASSATPSACGRTGRRGSCCGTSSSTPRPSSTTTATAAPACRCRGAPGRWPPTWRWPTASGAPPCSAAAWSGSPPPASCNGAASTSPSTPPTSRPTPPRTISLAGFTPTSGLVDIAEADAGLGGAVPRRRSRSPTGSCSSWPGRSTASRGSSNYTPTESAPSASGDQRAAAAHIQGGADAAAARRAPVPDHLRHRAHRDAHRAQHLPRRADARRHRLRRPDRHPPLHDAPRRGRAAGEPDRQLHRAGRQGALRRRGAGAAARACW